MVEANVIWWPDFCGKRSAYDAFWNDSISINTATPELTPCFQKTVLLWIPCGWLILSAILYIPYLVKERTVNRFGRSSCLNTWKMLLVGLLVVLAALELAATLSRGSGPEDFLGPLPVDYTEVVIKTVTMVLAAFLTGFAFRKGQHTSGVLFTFWLLMTLCGCIQAYSLSAQQNREGEVTELFRFTIHYIQFGLSILLFISNIPSDMGAFPTETVENEDDENAPLIPKKREVAIEEQSKNPCPRESANFLSHAFLAWYWGLVVKGYKRTLTYADMWDIRAEDASKNVFGRFQKMWGAELEKAERTGEAPSLRWALTKGFNWKIVLATLLLILSTTTSLLNPQVMNAVINFVQSSSPYMWQGYLLAVILFCLSVMGCVIMQQCYTLPCHVGQHLKSAVIASVYRKALRISNTARKTTTTGEVVNLMSVDAERLSDSMIFIHFLWVTPFTVVITMIFIYQKLGPSSLVGLAYLVIVLPLNSWLLGRFTRKYQRIQMGYKDLRLKLMSQILVGIKVLKLYAWEPYFQAKVTAIREEELSVIKKSAIVITLSYIVSFSSNLVVALLCFITYTLLSADNVLTPDKAFVSISLFNVLSTPIMFVPTALMFLMQALVSIERIQKFLLQPEISPDNVQHDPHKEGAINISDGTFSWGEAERVPLNDINLVVPTGSLVAVVGTVGSGKSSLLQAMLGEMDKVRGKVNMKGQVAYVPQQAWIQNLTVRDNILFDKPYVRNKYQKVLEACALTPDLKILQGGDLTEIGERGINLSGGQKQRVSLARAMYQNADVYLLDDPLSAVDSHVGKHIFEKVIGPYGQLSHTTRVFVTNAVTYLPKMDRIVVLKDGSISEVGSFDQLMANNGAFAEFLSQHISQQMESGVELDEDEREWARQVSAGTGGGGSLSGTEGDSLGTSGTSVRRRRKTPADRKPSLKKEVTKEALVTEETVQEGTVKSAVITAYLRACTFTWLFIMLLGLLINVGGNVGSNIWLSFWSNDALLAETTNVTTSVYLRLGVYGGLGLMQILGTFVLVGAVAFGAIQAARTIHKSLLDNNLKSPMSFFDTTPTGRILNRYSKDVDIVDTNMRNYIQNLVSNASIILATLTIIIYTTPIFIVILIPLVIIFIILQRIYVKTARQVKRIDSIKRSPIYANFSETLNGISSIRAFRQEDRFVEHADNLLDNSMKINYSVFISNRWIGIWLEMLGDVIVLFASIFSVLQRDTLDPGTVGLSLSYALQVSWQIVLMVRYSCELETYIVAVERIKEYTDETPEAPWMLEHRPHRDWPEEGAVDFRDYKTRYRAELGLVLKGLNCNIHAGEKVGIVGRTGAGKSSMTLALFRIIESAGGSIYIDGENIAEMGLHDLRSKLTIIPQDPVLFSGSLRFNLDPADQYSDAEVWAALEQAHLKTFVESLPDTFNYESGEDGENFSVGQRQLVCLARALLRRSRILIMDEATAAVDLETDDLIQTTIRTEFKDSTVITIAHRLNTVLDYDKVMMMDDGLIREYDSPQALLADSSTMFYSMAADAGLV